MTRMRQVGHCPLLLLARPDYTHTHTHTHTRGSRGNPCPLPVPGEHLKELSHKIVINCCHLSKNNESSVTTTR